MRWAQTTSAHTGGSHVGSEQDLCHGGSRLLGLNMSRREEEEEEEEVPWFAVTCWAERQRDSQERRQPWKGAQLAGGGFKQSVRGCFKK